MRYLIGPLVECLIADLLLLVADGYAIRGLPGLGFKELMDPHLLRVRLLGLVPEHYLLVLLGWGQQRQAGNGLIWISDNPLQQLLPVAHHPLDGLPLE